MIHHISLAECLEQFSPPEKVLDVSVIDDTAFVKIAAVDGDHLSERHTETAEISVSLPALIEALSLLATDQERENLRPKDRGGVFETKFAGRRLTVSPVAPWSAVSALTTHHRYEAPDPAEHAEYIRANQELARSLYEATEPLLHGTVAEQKLGRELRERHGLEL